MNVAEKVGILLRTGKKMPMFVKHTMTLLQFGQFVNKKTE